MVGINGRLWIHANGVDDEKAPTSDIGMSLGNLKLNFESQGLWLGFLSCVDPLSVPNKNLHGPYHSTHYISDRDMRITDQLCDVIGER